MTSWIEITYISVITEQSDHNYLGVQDFSTKCTLASNIFFKTRLC